MVSSGGFGFGAVICGFILCVISLIFMHFMPKRGLCGLYQFLRNQMRVHLTAKDSHDANILDQPEPTVAFLVPIYGELEQDGFDVLNIENSSNGAFDSPSSHSESSESSGWQFDSPGGRRRRYIKVRRQRPEAT